MYETLKNLHIAGHRVVVFALNTKKHYQPVSSVNGVCALAIGYDLDTSVRVMPAIGRLISRVKYSETGESVKIPYWVSRFIDRNGLELLKQTASNHGPFDAVICESLFTVWYGLALKWGLGHSNTPIPVVMRSHNLEYRIQEGLSCDKKRGLLERLYRSILARQTRKFERSVAEAVDAVAAISDTDAKGFGDLTSKANVVVVSAGVEIQIGSAHTHLATDSIGLLGSMDWVPNVEGTLWFLNEMFPRILKKRPQVILHIAGKNIPDSITCFHNGQNVFVHGEVSNAEEFRQSVAVMAVPLRSGSGVRIKILEALAQGCPVVSTTKGCEGLSLESGEHLVVADTPEAFATAIERVLSDHEFAKGLGQRGQKLVSEKFTWSASIRQLVSLVNCLKRNYESKA